MGLFSALFNPRYEPLTIFDEYLRAFESLSYRARFMTDIQACGVSANTANIVSSLMGAMSKKHPVRSRLTIDNFDAVTAECLLFAYSVTMRAYYSKYGNLSTDIFRGVHVLASQIQVPLNVDEEILTNRVTTYMEQEGTEAEYAFFAANNFVMPAYLGGKILPEPSKEFFCLPSDAQIMAGYTQKVITLAQKNAMWCF